MRRLPGLMIGLLMFGVAVAIMVRSALGLSPWEVFHQGVSVRTGVPIGTVSILVGVPVLLLWLPLREPPGIGTVLNILTIGATTNLVLSVLPPTSWLPLQLGYMGVGIALFAVGSGLYLSADLGPGPRDGLMTGIHRRFGWRISLVRGALELSVLAVGWAFGGTVGLGTILFALLIGPLVELSLRVFDRHGRVIRRTGAAGTEAVPVPAASV